MLIQMHTDHVRHEKQLGSFLRVKARMAASWTQTLHTPRSHSWSKPAKGVSIASQISFRRPDLRQR